MPILALPALMRLLVLLAVPGAVLLPLVAVAQDATPAGQTMRSPTHEEVWAEIMATFPLEEPRQQGGQVIYGVPSDLSTLNGLLASDMYSFAVTQRIYETLVDISPVDGQPIPELADWWEIAPDGVTYTFHLREDARWHDGTDVTAQDVVFSFDAALDPATGYMGQPDLAAAVAAYRAVDDSTVEMTSNGVLATFLWDLRYVAILPRHLWESVPRDQWASDPGSTGEDPSRVVGTGPFTLVEWVQGDHATLARNEAYDGVVPSIDEFVVSVCPDDATSVEALKAGEVDILEYLPTTRVAEFQQTEGFAVETFDTPGFLYYIPNLDPEKSPLFQDRAVREALFVALDRQALVDAVFLGHGDVANGTQPPLSFAYAPERVNPVYAYDPERARDLLAGAGWTDSNGDGTIDKDGQELAFELFYEDGWAEGAQIVTYLQEAWRAIGVAMTPKPASFPAVLEALTGTHEFDMVFIGFFWEPSAHQGFFFRCDAYEGGFNTMKYCNPRYDELDSRQRQELDPEARREQLIELTNLLWHDLPIGVLAFYDNRVGYSTRLHNYFPTGWGEALWGLPWVWVEE
jgi:peptide/nickel transport system substrate-binding protein